MTLLRFIERRFGFLVTTGYSSPNEVRRRSARSILLRYPFSKSSYGKKSFPLYVGSRNVTQHTESPWSINSSARPVCVRLRALALEKGTSDEILLRWTSIIARPCVTVTFAVQNACFARQPRVDSMPYFILFSPDLWLIVRSWCRIELVKSVYVLAYYACGNGLLTFAPKFCLLF